MSSLPQEINKGELNKVVQLFWGCFFLDYYVIPLKPQILINATPKAVWSRRSYSFPIQILFRSYSFPIHSHLFVHFLFVFINVCSRPIHSYSCHSLPIPFPFMFIPFCSFPLTWEIYQNSKARIFFLINLSFKNCSFQASNQFGNGGTHKSPIKCWAWMANHFLFMSYWFPI